jgi:GAF domain-containing protein/CheY-like chemotaxis protein
MSKQKNLQNRLDDLFADLESQSIPISTREDTIPGWTWECDPQGFFTKCSPEVKQVLGLVSDQFIGQSLYSYLLDAQSETALKNVFRNVDFPQDVLLRYQSANNQLVTVRTHIFPIESIDITLRGWRGYNQVISTETKFPTSPLTQTPARIPEVTPIQGISEIGLQEKGIAIEGNQIIPANGPYSVSGEASISKRISVVKDASQESQATVAVPVKLQDQFMGILEIVDDSPNRIWNEDELRLVEQVADQLALALENARLFQETQVSLSRTEALYKVGQSAIGFEDINQLLQAVVDNITEILPADRTIIAVFNHDLSGLTHLIESNALTIDILDDTFEELMGGLSGWCVRERKPALSPKGYADPRESLAASKTREKTDAASLLVVPLIYQDHVYGTLTAVNRNAQPDFTQDDVELLGVMSTQIATALANARLLQEEQRRRRIATTLSETARVVGATLELQDVGNRLLIQLAEVIEFDVASLQLIEGDKLRLISERRTIDQQVTGKLYGDWTSIHEDNLIQHIVKSQQPLVIPDTKNDSRWRHNLGSNFIRSWIGAPLLSGEDTIGLLFLYHRKRDVYDSDTADFISAIAAQVSVAIRNAELFRQVQRRSVQLQTASEVSRAANSILEPNPLIQQTVTLIQERFNLYYVGLFLVDESGEWTNEPGHWAVLRAGTGEAGRIQIERGHKLEINSDSMIGECIRTFEPQTPQSIDEDSPRYVNPLLPETKTEIALPLVSRGQVIGAMSIQSQIENAFSEEDISILQTMADQVANALQNANLFNLTQARAEELAVLNQMGQALSQDLEITSILKNIYLYASRLLDTSTFYVALFDEDTNEISFPLAIEDNRKIDLPARQLGAGLTEYVIHNRETILIHQNVEEWLEERGIELHLTGALPSSWLGIPLSIGNHVFGIVCVQNQEENHFSDHHAELLGAVANQSAIAIQNATLFEQTQDALSDTQALLNITSVASSSLELQDTLSNVLDQVLGTINGEAGLITIVDPQSKKLELVSYRLPQRMVAGILEKGLDGSLSDWVYQHTTPLVLGNLAENSPTDVAMAIGLGFKSYQGVPLEAKGRILGTLCTFSSRMLSEDENDIKLLSAVGQQIGVAIENANLFEQTQNQAAELFVLNEMSRVLSTQLEVEVIIETIYRYTSRLMDTSSFFIALNNPREDEISFPYVIEREEIINIPPMKKRRGLTQYIIDTREPLLISGNVEEKIIKLGLEEILIGDPTKSWLGVPMAIGDEVLGVIATQNADTPHVFNEHHQDLLVSVARQSAIAIQTARLFQATHRQTEDLAVLNQMSRDLTNILDRNEVANIVFQYTSRLMNTDNFYIATYDAVTKTVTIEFNILDSQRVDGVTMPAGTGLTGYIIEHGEPLLLEDDILTHMERLGIEIVPLGDDSIPLSWLGVPMLIGDEVMGAIAVQSITTPRLYDQRDRDLLLAIASHTAISLQNVQLFDQVQSAYNETTALYEAGAELNAVQSYDDILRVLRNHTILGENTVYLSINFFDRNWTEDQQPESYLPIAKWDQYLDERDHNQRAPIISWMTSEGLLNPREATIIEDPTTDTRLDEPIRQEILKGYDAKHLILAPLVMAGNWFGFINAIYDVQLSFSESEIRQMMTLVGQAAVAIQNLRSIEDSIRKAGQLETAAEIARDSSATLSVDELLNRSVNAVRDRFGFYHASIFLLDDLQEMAVIRASTGKAGATLIHEAYQLPVGSASVVGSVTQSGQPLVVNDIGQSSHHQPHPLLPDTKAELGLPLKIGNNVIGALDVQSVDTNAFHQDDIAVLQILADQISVALDNARSYQVAQDAIEETRRRVQDLTTLSHVSQTLASAPLEMQEVATIIAQQLEDVFSPQSSVSISLRDTINPDQMITIVSTNREKGKLSWENEPGSRKFTLSDFPATAEVMSTSEPKVIHISDTDSDIHELDYMKEHEIGTLVIMPLALKGQTIGVLELKNWKDEIHYSQDEIKLLTTLANQAAISLENARLYEEQLETTKQLRELDKLKSQFLANMSHELRTPLNSIIGFSRVIMKGIDGPITDLQQQDLSAIYNAGQHLLKMINDILDISKIDAGKMELAFEDVNIADIINSVMSTARGLVRDKPIELITEIEGNSPPVFADPTRVRQIFLNLLSNAAKFTDEGSITVTARQITGNSGKPELFLSVADTGMGIAPEDQDRLFEPFVQVDGSPTRSTGGTGLGLSITRMLVDLHNGEIGLESDLGQGSTFYFTLPISDTVSASTDGEVNTTILAIDDDIQVIQLYERYLTDTDFQIIPLGDPKSVLAYAREIQPFVITLDISIPDYDGWQLLEEIKNDPETCHIPVVICSIQDEVEKGLALGAQDYLLKPILAEDFVNAIRRIWESGYNNKTREDINADESDLG